MRLDSPDGKVAALLDVSGTGGWENWRYIESDAEAGVSGVHDVYFMFIGRKGPKLFNIDYWTFKR